MEIRYKTDVEKVAGLMHDSEFTGEDFRYSSNDKIFCMQTHIPNTNNGFVLTLYNVEKYTPLNLDKIEKGEAVGGVFDDIHVENQGLRLILISQDLRILLNLSKLDGKFEKTRVE